MLLDSSGEERFQAEKESLLRNAHKGSPDSIRSYRRPGRAAEKAATDAKALGWESLKKAQQIILQCSSEGEEELC